MSKNNMGKITEEILKIKIEDTMTIKRLYSTFFNLMRKYKIKQGTPCTNGRVKDNFEWAIMRRNGDYQLYNLKVKNAVNISVE